MTYSKIIFKLLSWLETKLCYSWSFSKSKKFTVHFYNIGNEECAACHYSCLTCDGPNEDDCLLCDSDTSLNRQVTPTDKQCVCNDHYFDNGVAECVICFETCFKCTVLGQNTENFRYCDLKYIN